MATLHHDATLVMQITELGHVWFRQLSPAWCQAIISTNDDFSLIIIQWLHVIEKIIDINQLSETKLLVKFWFFDNSAPFCQGGLVDVFSINENQ